MACTFVFVILHYKTSIDTIECIESIKILNDKSLIVVVDNASNNGSLEQVEEKFLNDIDVYFIKNQSNLGFAAANNIGYKFAKEQLKANYIAIINNDTIVTDKNIINKLEDNYLVDNFYVCGPDIHNSLEDTHQNPATIYPNNIKLIKKRIISYKVALSLSKCGLYNLLIKIFGTGTSDEYDIKWKERKEDVQLQGSFVIYSPSYINEEDFAFYPGTFLYGEEAIMYYYCKAKGYKTIYYPEIQIEHKGSSSTMSVFATSKKAYENKLKNISNSLNVLIEVLEKYY